MLLRFKFIATTKPSPRLKSMLWRSLNTVWQFSQFYGTYHALPVEQRRAFTKDWSSQSH